MGEKYLCFVDTENIGYEWGLLSDVDHQENQGFIRYPQKIEVLNQREFRNITAGPDFILSDTVLRETDLSANEVRLSFIYRENTYLSLPNFGYNIRSKM